MGRLNLSILEELDNRTGKYPSENLGIDGTYETFGQVIKQTPFGVIKGTRIKVKASDTTLWEENPRNFGPKGDYSELEASIKESNGNTQSVDARIVNGKVQVIAGSRRRQCCIVLGLSLTADLWDDVNDEVAYYIAETENSERLDIDLFSDCTYMANRFNKMKAKDPAMTVERFAALYKSKRRNMHNIFIIAKLPDYLKQSAKQRDLWSQRQALSLESLYREALINTSEEQIKLAYQNQLTTPSQVISLMKKFVNKKSEDKSAPIRSVSGLDFTIESKKSGLKLTCKSGLSDEQLEKIKEVLLNL